ncbi:MAG: hypothetical protein Roseis2KO_49160 [Roseivirga sp.]
MALAVVIHASFKAELTDYPIGTRLTNAGNNIGLEFMDRNGAPLDITKTFDNDFATSVELEPGNSIEFFLPRKYGKTPYPTEGFHISNGDQAGMGRIQTLRVDVKSRGFTKSCTYDLHDKLQWQYVRFPEVFWLGKSSSITLIPVKTKNNTNSNSRISQLAFQWE